MFFRKYLLDWLCGDTPIKNLEECKNYIKKSIAATIEETIRKSPNVQDLDYMRNTIYFTLCNTYSNMTIEKISVLNYVNRGGVGFTVLLVCSFLIKDSPLLIDYKGLHES